jgi:MFS family permease
MLGGSVLGGFIAQLTNLGVPYIVRSAMLGVTLVVAWWYMRDIGFTPVRNVTPVAAVRNVVSGAVEGGLRNPPVRWLMLAAPFSAGVGIYAFYALQPYLLELYGDPSAYGVAGLAAAFVAGAQIVGGAFVPWFRRFFRLRTDALILAGGLSALLLVFIGLTSSFILALALLAAWCISLAVATPLRSAYVNGEIPSEQRATVLSFDALMGSAGGVVAQPVLGRAADAFGYATSYVIAGIISAAVVPFTFLARAERASSDPIEQGEPA